MSAHTKAHFSDIEHDTAVVRAYLRKNAPCSSRSMAKALHWSQVRVDRVRFKAEKQLKAEKAEMAAPVYERTY